MFSPLYFYSIIPSLCCFGFCGTFVPLIIMVPFIAEPDIKNWVRILIGTICGIVSLLCLFIIVFVPNQCDYLAMHPELKSQVDNPERCSQRYYGSVGSN